MKTRSIRRYAGFLACVAPVAASAQQATPTELAPVVVTGSLTQQKQQDMLGDVSVIKRAAIERAGQSSVAELLQRQPGVEINHTGGPQTATSVFLRGANSNQTLLLIDGRRMNTATLGSGNFQGMPLDNIERIEILRGAASSLYGADAIGGVINIITRQGGSDRPLNIRADVGYGTHDTSRSSIGLDGAADGWRYALNAGYGRSRGYNATAKTVGGQYNKGYNGDRDGYEQNDVSGSLGYAWKPGQEIAFDFYHSKMKGQYDGGFDKPFNEYNDRLYQTINLYTLSSSNQLTDWWRSTVRLSQSTDTQRNQQAPGTWGFPEDGETRFRTRQEQYTWQNTFDLAANQTVTLGYEHLKQRVSGDLFESIWPAPDRIIDYGVDSRITNSFFGEYRTRIDRHHVQVNLRSDHNTLYGNKVTGGAEYGFDITQQLRAGIGANTGFRAPTFNDLYWGNDGGTVGNPNLKPESSRNIELSLHYVDDSTTAGIVAYRSHVKDLIVWADRNDGSYLWSPENVGRAELRGITLTGSQRLGQTTLRASADFQDPHDRDNGNTLALRARQIYRASAEHRFGPATAGVEYLWSGPRYANAANTQELGGYGLVNLTASYDVSKNLTAYLRWNNLFNKDYTLARGYNTPGSTVFLNLAWRM
ncbi:TonB-dependent receptor domain-containing protein [Bordetella avium]|uniref:TonB-dependent receptor domain-containing protein n=1 Tax=Bordetella avium TaxID=521 RepID=UPI000E0A3726|nr:TonB-dependent receptor [Bordetella avium]AZY53803.1 TonB-dependent receptor [Bordetella avium]RIQ15425.1 TonB-dependent receptor [Bordetella avium]RIQ38465.1 TonB-dependent receptor [Bordetella avium]RIQ43004.1 TonB-dependent receptor [Bordetella avium]RIQ44061.1 TonB-dependent receptor [Bordetella avium]